MEDTKFLLWNYVYSKSFDFKSIKIKKGSRGDVQLSGIAFAYQDHDLGLAPRTTNTKGEGEAGGHTETILFGVWGLLFSDILLHLVSIRNTTLPTTVAYTSNASTQKTETEGTKVQGQSELLKEAYLIKKKKKKHCSNTLM